MKQSISIGLIGGGYWGINLIRNFNKLGALKIVSDIDVKKKKAIQTVAPGIPFTSDYKTILKDKKIDAIVVSTPAKTHFKMVKAALLSEKHVFVEKPLCLRYEDGKKLQKLANNKKLKIMVGHLLLYHPAYQKLREEIYKGIIGQVRYIYSNRLSLGKLRKEEDVLWSFAPHDISMILNLVNEKLSSIEAYGASYLHKKVKDTTITLLKFKNNIKAHIFVSWLHPYKDQRLVIVGEKGMLVFADVLDNKNKLLFYNHDVRWDGNIPVINKMKGQRITFDGSKEPLYWECKAFIDWLTLDITPPSSCEEGLSVLRVLELAKEKLKKW